jgi:hypothetical protein
MNGIFDVNQLLVSWDVKKHALVFDGIIDKRGEE